MSNLGPPGSTSAVRVAVGSTNPAKLAAVEAAVGRYLRESDVEPVELNLDVPTQPWGDDETLRGAELRAREAQSLLDADVGAGLESGVVDGPYGRLYAVSWAFLVDRYGRTGIGGSERFPLPEPVVDRIRSGGELGPVMDEVLPNTAGRARIVGAVNVVTASRRDRIDLLTGAVLLALADLLEPWRVG
jgi:inosine/xanthosine triphosphatase